MFRSSKICHTIGGNSIVDASDLQRGYDLFAQLGAAFVDYENQLALLKPEIERGRQDSRHLTRMMAGGNFDRASVLLDRAEEEIQRLCARSPWDWADIVLASRILSMLGATFRVSTRSVSARDGVEPWRTFRDKLTRDGQLNLHGAGIVLPGRSEPFNGLVFVPQGPGIVRLRYSDETFRIAGSALKLSDVLVLFHAGVGDKDMTIAPLATAAGASFEVRFFDESALAYRTRQYLDDTLKSSTSPTIVIFPELSVPELSLNSIKDLLLSGSARNGLFVIAGSRLADRISSGPAYNQATLFLNNGDELSTHNKNWPFVLPDRYCDEFQLSSLGLSGGEVEFIRIPSPPEMEIIDLGFLRFAVIICEELAHLDNMSTLSSIVRAQADVLFVLVMSGDLTHDWTERFGKWAAERGTIVVVSNSRYLPDRSRDPLAEQNIGLIIRSPYGPAVLPGDGSAENTRIPILTSDLTASGFTGKATLGLS